MVYVVHLYECDQKHSSLFASSFDHDGLFAEIGKELVGHLHTQLRPHSSRPHTYLAIEFWLTEDDYCAALRMTAFHVDDGVLTRVAIDFRYSALRHHCTEIVPKAFGTPDQHAGTNPKAGFPTSLCH